MAVNVSMQVGLIPREGGYRNETDISRWVLGVPRFTDTGLDDVNSALIVLDSPFGEFLTRTGEGAPPIIGHNDHFRIRCTAENGSKYDREFEYAPADGALVVDETAERGRTINLKLLGIEYHTQKINYIGSHRWDGGEQVVDDIIRQYNSARGEAQPELIKGNIEIPSWTRNTYPFDSSLKSVWGRLQDVALSFGAPVSAGGVLDFFTVGFETGGDSANRITLNMRSLGYVDGQHDEITSGTLSADEDKKRTGFSPAKFNRVIGDFDTQAGTLPTNFARFTGLIDRYNFLPYWSPSVEYPEGAEVRAPGTSASERGPVFRAKGGFGAGTPTSNRSAWTTVTYESYISGIQYSPWTDDKRTLWRNSGVAPGSGVVFGNSMPDFNIVIKSSEYWQVPVDTVSSSPNLPINLTYPGRTPYRGLTVLVLEGSGTWTAFNNKVVMFDGSEWVVKYDEFKRGHRVLDESRGVVFEFSGSTWEVTADENAYTCLHPVDGIDNVQGMIDPAGPNNTNTAVRGRWTLRPATSVVGEVLKPFGNIITEAVESRILKFLIGQYLKTDDDTMGIFRVNPDKFKYGQSLRIKFPFPCNTSGGIGEEVGELYGGTASNPEPATIDIANETYTSSGKRLYNNDESEDLGRMSSISFGIRIDHYTGVGRLARIPRPNTRVRSTIRDMRDNIVFADFEVPFNGEYLFKTINFAEYRPYVAIAPKRVIDRVIPPKEVEQANEFRWHEIRDFTWTIYQPYDDHGRFDPGGEGIGQVFADGSEIFKTTGRNFLSHFNVEGPVTIDMTIDNLHFNKKLLVVSPPNKEWNQEYVARVPDIFSYQAGLNYVLSEQEKQKFPKEEYDITVRGNFDIRYGEEFEYTNQRVISGRETVSGRPNTERIAALHIEHSWLSGGLSTNILAGRRFRA